MSLNADYPVVYTTHKITNEYSFELKIMAKDENTLNEVMKMLKGEIGKQQEEIEILSEENEQLKREIQQLRHWNKCLAEKRHDILMKMDNIDYGYYVDNKTKKELEEMLNQKVLNCSDRD